MVRTSHGLRHHQPERGQDHVWLEPRMVRAASPTPLLGVVDELRSGDSTHENPTQQSSSSAEAQCGSTADVAEEAVSAADEEAGAMAVTVKKAEDACAAAKEAEVEDASAVDMEADAASVTTEEAKAVSAMAEEAEDASAAAEKEEAFFAPRPRRRRPRLSWT